MRSADWAKMTKHTLPAIRCRHDDAAAVERKLHDSSAVVRIDLDRIRPKGDSVVLPPNDGMRGAVVGNASHGVDGWRRDLRGQSATYDIGFMASATANSGQEQACLDSTTWGHRK